MIRCAPRGGAERIAPEEEARRGAGRRARSAYGPAEDGQSGPGGPGGGIGALCTAWTDTISTGTQRWKCRGFVGINHRAEGIDAAGPRSRQISLCGFGEGVEMCLISTQDMYGGIDAAGPRSRGNARIERSTDLITLESESARSHGSVVGGSCRRRDRRREAAGF